MNNYIPINCHFYDQLEAIATIGKSVKITYMDNSSKVETSGKIRDLFTKESVEYMKLDSGVTFRLDKLVEIDGKQPPGVC